MRGLVQQRDLLGVATDGQLGNGASALTSQDPVSVTTVTGWTPLEVSVSTSSGIGGNLLRTLLERLIG